MIIAKIPLRLRMLMILAGPLGCKKMGLFVGQEDSLILEVVLSWHMGNASAPSVYLHLAGQVASVLAGRLDPENCDEVVRDPTGWAAISSTRRLCK